MEFTQIYPYILLINSFAAGSTWLTALLLAMASIVYVGYEIAVFHGIEYKELIYSLWFPRRNSVFIISTAYRDLLFSEHVIHHSNMYAAIQDYIR